MVTFTKHSDETHKVILQVHGSARWPSKLWPEDQKAMYTAYKHHNGALGRTMSAYDSWERNFRPRNRKHERHKNPTFGTGQIQDIIDFIETQIGADHSDDRETSHWDSFKTEDAEIVSQLSQCEEWLQTQAQQGHLQPSPSTIRAPGGPVSSYPLTSTWREDVPAPQSTPAEFIHYRGPDEQTKKETERKHRGASSTSRGARSSGGATSSHSPTSTRRKVVPGSQGTRISSTSSGIPAGSIDYRGLPDDQMEEETERRYRGAPFTSTGARSLGGGTSSYPPTSIRGEEMPRTQVTQLAPTASGLPAQSILSRKMQYGQSEEVTDSEYISQSTSRRPRSPAGTVSQTRESARESGGSQPESRNTCMSINSLLDTGESARESGRKNRKSPSTQSSSTSRQVPARTTLDTRTKAWEVGRGKPKAGSQPDLVDLGPSPDTSPFMTSSRKKPSPDSGRSKSPRSKSPTDDSYRRRR